MSYQYDEYLIEHRSNVKRAYHWLRENFPVLFDDVGSNLIANSEWLIVSAHDQSKLDREEYVPYDAYFYGGNRSFEVVQAFNRAFLAHIHCNPHHWQYWVLLHDDPNEPEECIEIPSVYIIEMICDWWSFSWKSGDLKSIFGWWDEHKDYIKLHPESRKSVEDILEKIKNKLEEK